MSYHLVNPYIEGSMKTSFTASSALKAADAAWLAMSEHYTNKLPKFAFTLQKGGVNGKLYHFEVREDSDDSDSDQEGGGDASYTITPLNKVVSKDDEQVLKQFVKKSKEQEDNKSGGSHRKRKDKSSSSSSSSSSDDELTLAEKALRYERRRNYNRSIALWTYHPYVYRYEYNIIPTFAVSTPPFVVVRPTVITHTIYP